jgi:hypothetical protein
LANSFISFPDLYDPQKRALFEMGTLIMDGRHFTLAVRVLNRAQHVQFSEASNMFVLYAEVSNKEGEPLYEVAIPVTSGNRGNLQVNKWGVFHDIHGRELYARVVQIVENPISLAEAISAPFRRLGQNITKRFGEKAAEAEAHFQTAGTQTLTSLPPAGQGEPRPATRTEMRLPGGVLAGGGIAVAALGGSLAYIIRTLMELSLLQLLGGVAGLALAVLMPVTLVACIKLARRDLSAILEGSGWGLNFRMRLTMRQALTFTYAPAYPAGTLAIRRRGWIFWLLIALLIAMGLGSFLFGYLRPPMPENHAPATPEARGLAVTTQV